MRAFAILTAATLLVLAITPAYADIVEVTFTGIVTSLPFGGVEPVVGVTVGDPFTAVLTYNENQPDENPAPGIGHYFDYTFGLAVHTSSGDVIVPGSIIAAIEVSDNDVSNSADLVHNAASAGDTAHFYFSDSSMAALSSDALSEVNWLALLTLSEIAQVRVRAFNLAVIMAGDITSLEVARAVEPAGVILGAEVNFKNHSLLISGRNFGVTAPFSGIVRLFVPMQGELELNVLAFDPLTQEILADLPAGIEDTPGTFRLTVSKESDPPNADDFAVTIVPSSPGQRKK